MSRIRDYVRAANPVSVVIAVWLASMVIIGTLGAVMSATGGEMSGAEALVFVAVAVGCFAGGGALIRRVTR